MHEVPNDRIILGHSNFKSFFAACMWTSYEEQDMSVHKQKDEFLQCGVISILNVFLWITFRTLTFAKFKGILATKTFACFAQKHWLCVFSVNKFGPAQGTVLVKCKWDWAHTPVYSRRERTATTVDISGHLFKTTTLVVNLQMLEWNFASHALKKKKKEKVWSLRCVPAYLVINLAGTVERCSACINFPQPTTHLSTGQCWNNRECGQFFQSGLIKRREHEPCVLCLQKGCGNQMHHQDQHTFWQATAIPLFTAEQYALCL